MNKPLCYVSCPIDSYSGYGQRSRDFVKALYNIKGEEWEIRILSQRWGATPWGYLEDNKEEWEWIFDKVDLGLGLNLPKQPDYWFMITVPNEFTPVGKVFNVGVTAGVETDICDPALIQGINKMNLTLVSSEFSKSTFVNSTFKENNTNNLLKLEKPVEVLFEGVDIHKFFYLDFKSYPKTDLTESLDSIKESFSFLFVGHWLQGDLGHDRKNVGYMIKSFLTTFKNVKNKPALVIKTAIGGSSIMDRDEILNRIDKIKQEVGGDLPNIYLLHGELDDSDINLLYNHPKIKAMVSLTKGEGFGRPLLEFTQSKKIIATSGWSGHLDFLDREHTYLIGGSLQNVHQSAISKGLIIPEAKWFYTDDMEVSKMWTTLFKDYDKLNPLALETYKRCKTEFSFDKMQEKLDEIIKDKFIKITPLKLPLLKKI
jgi:glycosyltransferase involved in cell wall biosynthesis